MQRPVIHAHTNELSAAQANLHTIMRGVLTLQQDQSNTPQMKMRYADTIKLYHRLLNWKDTLELCLRTVDAASQQLILIQ